jgi:hypothetical protein
MSFRGIRHSPGDLSAARQARNFNCYYIRFNMQPSPENIVLSYHQSITLMQRLSSLAGVKVEMDYGKSRCLVLDQQGEKILEFHYPLCFPGNPSGQNLPAYAASLPAIPIPCIILLMHAGQSALGYFARGEMQQHKVIRKYMVRKKQGKAQYKFQKEKKAHSQGARIRLANTVTFFEEINTYLQEWFKSNPVGKIIYSCPPPLWSMLFRSKINPPFQKEDPRLIKVPLHLPDPLLKTLLYINHYIQSGKCVLFEESTGDATEVLDIIYKSISL